MKYLKKYQIFCEECDGGGTATTNASNTAGMGAVVASQPGSFPGTTGTTGSGDVGSTMAVYQKAPIKITFCAHRLSTSVDSCYICVVLFNKYKLNLCFPKSPSGL